MLRTERGGTRWKRRCVGYEQVIARAGQINLTDAELEALRNAQRKIAPLSGPIVTMTVILYLALFVLLWTYLL